MKNSKPEASLHLVEGEGGEEKKTHKSKLAGCCYASLQRMKLYNNSAKYAFGILFFPHSKKRGKERKSL